MRCSASIIRLTSGARRRSRASPTSRGATSASSCNSAAEIPIKPEVQEYALEDANVGLVALKSSSIRGAKVLRVNS